MLGCQEHRHRHEKPVLQREMYWSAGATGYFRNQHAPATRSSSCAHQGFALHASNTSDTDRIETKIVSSSFVAEIDKVWAPPLHVFAVFACLLNAGYAHYVSKHQHIVKSVIFESGTSSPDEKTYIVGVRHFKRSHPILQAIASGYVVTGAVVMECKFHSLNFFVFHFHFFFCTVYRLVSNRQVGGLSLRPSEEIRRTLLANMKFKDLYR